MGKLTSKNFPQSIVCLTEESVEFLYDLKCEELIVGVSSFVKRPKEALDKPVVTTFTHANLKKITGHAPDLVLGFSDIQKDIARELIGEGLNVYISNHRSLEETLDFLLFLGRMVDKKEESQQLVDQYREDLDRARERGQKRNFRPRVYTEEWDSPQISGITWFKEIVEICGGRDIFDGQKSGAMAKSRIVNPRDVAKENPDIVLASWCGKPVDSQQFGQREGWAHIEAIKNQQCYEIPSEIILQPGPALFKEALNLIHQIFDGWEKMTCSK